MANLADPRAALVRARFFLAKAEALTGDERREFECGVPGPLGHVPDPVGLIQGSSQAQPAEPPGAEAC